MNEQNGSKWYERAGESPEVVCSTRVRLARNLRGVPFPDRAGPEDKARVIELARGAVMNSNSVISREFSFYQLGELSREEAVSLCERHMVSPDFIADRRGKAVLISADESVSIMVNEEDHIRIQVMREGQAVEEALETAERIDTLLSENLDYAFDRELGYLTQCPTNLGTGMRASLTLHLPGITESGSIGRVEENLSKLGFALRGAFGEGSRPAGDMYQISNQISLGLSEKEAAANLLAIAGQVAEQEKRVRTALLKETGWQDKVARAAGVLKTARLVSGQEAAELLSYVRLGLAQGFLSGADLGDINGLSVRVQPATLMSGTGKTEPEERDRIRADIIRETLKDLNIT